MSGRPGFVDTIALEAARDIQRQLAEREFPGGDCQRLAAIQVGITDAIKRAVKAVRDREVW